MFHSISWGRYCTALLIALVIYYSYVFWVYYRKNLFQKKGSSINNQADINDTMTPEVRSLTDEITAYFQQAAQVHAVKPEIIYALKHIIRKYPSVKGSSYEQAINKILQFECKDQCAVHLDAMELKQVWMV